MALIIAIDASTNNIGYAVMSLGEEKLLASGVIHLGHYDDFYERLKRGPRLLKECLKETNLMDFPIDTIVIEQPFFTNGPSVGKSISYMIGGCLCILAPWCTNVFEVAAGQWYSIFCGIKKPNVKGMKPVERLLAMKGPIVQKSNELYGLNLDVLKDNDRADAIGMAKAYCYMKKSNYFDLQKDAKDEKSKKKKLKMAQKKAAKTGKPIKGELPL
jgi:Holliday junction resolvasome RuvABC endonuclease subunit